MENQSEKLDAILASVERLHAKIDAALGTGATSTSTPIIKSSNKGITLAELARRTGLENGQQRVAAIVGYFEKLQGKNDVTIADLQQGWKDGKFSGSYAAIYLHRALKEGLVRQKAKGAYDLTQTGEDFFAKLFDTNN